MTVQSTVPSLKASPANDKGVFTMKVGQTASLVVSDPTAPDPDVEGRSVQVVEVNKSMPPVAREWELRAVSQRTRYVPPEAILQSHSKFSNRLWP